MATKPKSIEVMTKHLTKAERERKQAHEQNLKEALAKIKIPDWLDIQHRKRFSWFAAQYKKIELLTILDANMLARYVIYEARFAELERLIKEQGFMNNDQSKLNPLLAEQRHTSDKLEKLEIKLGMNPSDRLRFAVPQVQEVDELEAFKDAL